MPDVCHERDIPLRSPSNQIGLTERAGALEWLQSFVVQATSGSWIFSHAPDISKLEKP
jgi:hypothetical protein